MSGKLHLDYNTLREAGSLASYVCSTRIKDGTKEKGGEGEETLDVARLTCRECLAFVKKFPGIYNVARALLKKAAPEALTVAPIEQLAERDRERRLHNALVKRVRKEARDAKKEREARAAGRMVQGNLFVETKAQ